MTASRAAYRDQFSREPGSDTCWRRDAASSIGESHAGSGGSAGDRKRGIGPLMSGSGSANFESANPPVRGTYRVQVHGMTVKLWTSRRCARQCCLPLPENAPA